MLPPERIGTLEAWNQGSSAIGSWVSRRCGREDYHSGDAIRLMIGELAVGNGYRRPYEAEVCWDHRFVFRGGDTTEVRGIVLPPQQVTRIDVSD